MLFYFAISALLLLTVFSIRNGYLQYKSSLRLIKALKAFEAQPEEIRAQNKETVVEVQAAE